MSNAAVCTRPSGASTMTPGRPLMVANRMVKSSGHHAPARLRVASTRTADVHRGSRRRSSSRWCLRRRRSRMGCSTSRTSECITKSARSGVHHVPTANQLRDRETVCRRDGLRTTRSDWTSKRHEWYGKQRGDKGTTAWACRRLSRGLCHRSTCHCERQHAEQPRGLHASNDSAGA
jgi:hypothetical protein